MKSFLAFLTLAVTLHAAPPEPKFRAVTIDDKIQIGYGVAVADVDGDGRPDILLADKKQFVWYQNPGQPPPGAASFAPSVWSKFVIAENLTEHDNVCLAAQDIDGDGKCEIAVGAEWNPGDTVNSGAVFYMIPPADRTQKWEPVKFPNVEPTTHRMKWMELPTDAGEPRWGLVVVPLHGRGNKNGEGAPVKVLLYHKPADVRGEWRSEVVDESMHMTHNFEMEPRAADGHILLAGREGIAELQSQHGRWQRSVVSQNNGLPQSTAGVGEVRYGLLPLPIPPSSIKLPDQPATAQRTGSNGIRCVAAVEPMHGNSLVAYIPSIDGIGVAMTRRVLTDQLIDGHALACGDLLGTGNGYQIVVGWRAMGKPDAKVGVHLLTPLDSVGKDWRDSAVDDGGMACEDLVLADLNGDGKLDIVASGRATHNVKVYFNETPRPAAAK